MQGLNQEKSIKVLLLLFLVIAALYLAKQFLVPVCFGGLFAMLLLPLTRKLERIGINRGISTFFSVLAFIMVIAGIITLIAWQINNLTDDLGNIQGRITEMIGQFKNYISRAFGISLQQQDKILEQQSQNGTDIIAKLGSSIAGTLVDFVLMLVYIFLFLYYRSHLKKFILKLVPNKDDEIAEDTITNIEKVSQQYLLGMGLMILSLWIMYSIGFTLVGLKNAFFFAIMCGLFEMVPYIGNLTGNLLAILMAVTQGGGMPMVLGIIITYALVQFIQTYLLEPLVVGNEVNINPLFTILGLVLGELIWGISGLILAIPLLGIFKIICDHSPSLKPYGFLIGSDAKKENTLVDRLKGLFKKK